MTTNIKDYSTTQASNTSLNTIDVNEGMLPSNLNNAIRALMKNTRDWFNDSQWIEYGDGSGSYTAAYASSTSFTINGADVTSVYHTGRRIKLTAATPGTIFGTISSSSFSTNTTVNVTWDSGSLSSETISNVYISALSKTNSSIPTEIIGTTNITDSAVTSAKLASNAITTAKITDGNVTLAKLASDSVNGTKIADDSINSEHYVDASIDTAHIADAQITTAKITDGNVTLAKMAADSVNGSKIADDSINSEHYVDGSIDTAHIADSQVTTAKIADSQITSAKITDGAIVNADINASAAIDATKIANGTVTSAEFQYINTLSSNAQTQIDAKAATTYVDNAVAGLRTRIIAECATTANVNLSNGLEAGDAIDGVTLVSGDRVLVKDQSTASENGLYLAVGSGAGAASRDPEHDTIAELSGGMVVVNQGTANDNKIFLCTTDTDATLDTTSITYTTITPQNVGTVTSITAGTGLSGGAITSSGTIAIDSTVATLSGTQTLTNKTLTSPKINEDVVLTSNATELNLLDGVSGLVQADFTKLAAIDSSATELNTLDGLSRGSIIYGNASAATAILTKGSANTVLTSDGTDISWAAVAAGVTWQTIVTGSTLTAVAGRAYWINTTSNTCTITLPSSASNGDELIFADYARTWGTNKIIIDSNGLKYQGQDDTYTVEYNVSGSTLHIVYSGATKGWIPLDDDTAADVPVAPATQRAIFGFGYSSSFLGLTNLVNSSGVVQADVSAVGTARRQLTASTYGGDKGIFFGGVISPGGNANASRISNLVNNSGVVQSDVANSSGSVTVKYQTAMTVFGSTGQALSAFGSNSSEANINIRNIISSSGVVADDVSGAGTAKTAAAGAPYGGDKGIIAYGYPDPSSNVSNLVSNTGVVGSDRSGVGTARVSPGAAGYGTDKAIFAYGEYTNHVNLVSNTGVVATDTTAGGTARSLGAGASYGGDKALFYGGNTDGSGKVNYANLVTNLGVVGANQSAVGTARSNIGGAGYSYTA